MESNMKRIFTALIIVLVLAFGYLYRDSLRSRARSTVKKIQPPACAFTKNVLPKMKKDAYSKHRKSGKNLPDMNLIEDNTVHKKLVNDGILVRIRKSDGYQVQPMSYGSPYVHKDMFAVLTELEQEFIKEVAKSGYTKSRFSISSASRTSKQQTELGKINPSATKGDSSHSYGASVDIFQVVGHNCEETRTILANLLIKFQKEKKLYLTPESKTIHITIRTH